ncbi:hypothetical protein [Terrarubrum flagellatum]|uniref:hypothetical protein n=1 Tax=Terrirubrum flagellatum TaxID=2895980 RepID=UPI003144E96C
MRKKAAPKTNPVPAESPSASERFRADIDELRHRLSAVVNATSEAATTIISGLEDVIAESDNAQDRAFDALSACVFHDIVGQHVARAAELLAIIEKLGAAEKSTNTAAASESIATAKRRADRLAHGPALDTESHLGQTAIDDLFTEEK